MIKYLVISPPRSGTSSICKMASICGLKISHVLRKPFCEAVKEFDFFADTPFYSLEFLMGLLNCDNNFKFIYLTRSAEDIISSMKRIGIFSYMDHPIDEVHGFSYANDYFAWNGLRKLGIDSHKERAKLLAATYNIDMLEYDFSMGWKPFCDFIGADIPDCEIPHLNKFEITNGKNL